MSYSRTQPFPSFIQERYLLSKESSSKETYHLSLNLKGACFPYQPGDSIAILPSNCPSLINCFLSCLKWSGDELIFDPKSKLEISTRVALETKLNLSKTTPLLIRIISEHTHSEELKTLLNPENRSELIQFLESKSPLCLLNQYPGISFSPEKLLKCFAPLLPRFYSIASAPSICPEEIHLTIAMVRYMEGDALQYGTASHFLCKRAQIGTTKVPIYLHPSRHFLLPKDPRVSVIMVGPGTGVAPFRAFLQERIAQGATGKNWLFFGERNSHSDFYYKNFFLSLEQKNQLRLDLAFSRDGPEKFYVQHRLWDQRKDVWKWLQEGAIFYVCGDAKNMAKDVESALSKIAQTEGNLSEDKAREWVKELRFQKRYLTDVY